jgi:hypothetical protein
MEELGGEEYSSYSFSTSALDGGEWSASRPGRALAPEKGPPVPIVQEAGWAPEPVWTQRTKEKIFCPCRGSNPDRPVVQPVVFRANTSTNCDKYNIWTKHSAYQNIYFISRPYFIQNKYVPHTNNSRSLSGGGGTVWGPLPLVQLYTVKRWLPLAAITPPAFATWYLKTGPGYTKYTQEVTKYKFKGNATCRTGPEPGHNVWSRDLVPPLSLSLSTSLSLFLSLQNCLQLIQWFHSIQWTRMGVERQTCWTSIVYPW